MMNNYETIHSSFTPLEISDLGLNQMTSELRTRLFCRTALIIIWCLVELYWALSETNICIILFISSSYSYASSYLFISVYNITLFLFIKIT